MQRSAAVLEKNYLKTSNYKILGKYISLTTISFMIMGLLLSRSILVESIAPLGIAFFICMVKWDRYKVPVFASTILGTILSANSTLFIAKYCVCLTLIMLLSSRLKKIEGTPLLALVGAGWFYPSRLDKGYFLAIQLFKL
ncbi:hypothetical protein [Metaclostridioides mangenotii]|uniref:hypothetical protein n=1 Tax=Metaclostridioides mangenotii TaxID=1540 RepID=UPI0024186E5B|nr:hypothetical protein [Clostridioides mangenotii]